MNYEKTINEKKPIVNGSVNPSLTLDEMLQFDVETKRTFIHYLQVDGHFNNHHSNIDKEVFTELPDLYEYSGILAMSEAEANEALSKIWNRRIGHNEKMKDATFARHYDLGGKIFKAQQDLNFSGELTLSIGQLCGYNKAVGHWNDFDPAKINNVLQYLEKVAPRRNCGINNPNTGSKEYKWIANNDYIYMHVDYAYQEEVDTWNQWFKQKAVIMQRELKADSMRIAIADLGSPIEHTDRAFSITVVMWWD